MSRDRQWMPLFAEAFIHDTDHLTSSETGQYMLLLMSMWAKGAPLPDEPRRLARIARCRRVSEAVMKFFDRKDGVITQKRLMLELERAFEITKKRTLSGQLGGMAKAANALKDNDAPVANAKANVVAKPYTPHHTTTTLVTKSEKITSTEGEFGHVFWPVYPHKTGKPRALRAWHAARKRAELSDIMGGLKVYVETKPADRPWLNPATFLNEDRWADEPAPILPKRNRSEQLRDKLMKEAFDAEHNDHSRRYNGGDHTDGLIPISAPRPGGLSETADHVIRGKADEPD